MDQQQQSCRKHDFFVSSTPDTFLRTCLACGLAEEYQLSEPNKQVDPWEGWLQAEIKPLSWPRCVQYSETIKETMAETARRQKDFYSHRPNRQTSSVNKAKIERNPYTYSDLDKGSCIRLLELSPGGRLEILSGRLFEVKWEQETCPPYSALSYTWADDEGDTSLRNLMLLGNEQKVLRITRNCDRALRALRHKTNSRLLWVDSICINQSSDSERSHQVGLMKTIYSKATTVHSYVGEAVCGNDSTGREAMNLLKDLQLNGISDMLSTSETSNISILNKFFSRPYFARLWVVQEVLLAQSVTMHCQEVSLTVSNDSMSQLYGQGVKVPSWIRFAGRAKSKTERAPLDLRDLLASTSVCRVTDLRDKVFGLLGLVGDAQASDLSPNYELMIREVYIGVAAYLMEKDHCCDLIQHANPSWMSGTTMMEDVYGIPSWVPTWAAYTPLQTSESILKHIQQIESDSKRQLEKESQDDYLTICRIDGWPHDENSECDTMRKRCKMIHSESGSLATKMEIAYRFDSLSLPIRSLWGPVHDLDNNDYFTGFWYLKDGIKLAVRSFAWALKCAYTENDVCLIRVEGCSTLFLARQTSESLRYQLISSCVTAIVCPTRVSTAAEIFKPAGLERDSQFTPITVEMIHFTTQWRNLVHEAARLEPRYRISAIPIERQSRSESSEDYSKIPDGDWKSWIHFLSLETVQTVKNYEPLQRQLLKLVEIWHVVHALHRRVRAWITRARAVCYRRLFEGWCASLHDATSAALEGFLRDSELLIEAFRRITGIGINLKGLHSLRLLLDRLANSEVKWADDRLLGYPNGVEGFGKDYHDFAIEMGYDIRFLKQAFPLDLNGIHPIYRSMKQAIEGDAVFAGLVRGYTEAKDIRFV